MTLTRIYDRWDELGALLDKASSLPAEEIDAFCVEACGKDKELLDLLRGLLESAPDADDQVRESIAQVAEDAAGDDLLLGTSIGPYQVDELLGRGGMGEVYLASRADGEFDKKVAIKVVRARLPSDAAAELSRNERQVMANLNHPAIPTLVDSGQLDDGRPYFICDFVDGVPIDEYCEVHKLSTAARLEVLRGVGEAVQHAHTNLVLHLDIKPNNVLVQPDGMPSLLDFGVARLIGERTEGRRAFSPGYASPEQIRGQPLSVASDVYSLGALMYCLLAGEPPFAAPSQAPSETILEFRAEFVQRLERDDGLRHIDRDLRAIVHRAMEEDPAVRYSTVDAFLRDLKHYRHDLPVAARAGTFGYRLGKYLRRHRVAVTLVAVAFAALAGFGLREAELRRQAQAASAAAQTASEAAELASRQAEREAETARRVSAFLTNIFDVNDPSEARGNTVTARELLDKAAQRIEQDLADQPLVAANMMRSMGRAYAGLGLHEQATPILERAVGLRETTGETQSVEHADLLYEMGEQYLRVGRHADARRTLDACLAIRDRELGDRHRAVIEVLLSLGRLNTLTDNFDPALEQLERALAIAEATLEPDDPLLTMSLSRLGFLFQYLTRYQDAVRVYERAVAIEEARGQVHARLGDALKGLGGAYNALDRNEDALVVIERAIEVSRQVLGDEHPQLASVHYERANIYLASGRYEAAERDYLAALAIQESKLGPMHPASAFSIGALSGLYLDMERLEDALRMSQRALAIMRHVHPEGHGNVSLEKATLAAIYLELGRLDEAERMIEDAVEHYVNGPQVDMDSILDAQWTQASIFDAQGRGDDAAGLYARVFAAYEARKNLPREWAQDVAQKYADFLRSRGQDADPEALVQQIQR